MMRSRLVPCAFVAALCAANTVAAQARAAAPPATIPPVAEQVAAAVLPLPADMRAGAEVMGYKAKDKLEVLRPGTSGMICLALYVVRQDFHVACYHKSLEPFMARGRELRAQGMADVKMDSVRSGEVASGKLKMPKEGALYSLTGKKGAWDPATGKVSGVRPLSVVYMPFATTETTGLSSVPQQTGPWLMLPGTAKAHIMLVGAMTP